MKEVTALIGVLAGAFKAVTSGLKDLQEISEKRKRRPSQRKRRK